MCVYLGVCYVYYEEIYLVWKFNYFFEGVVGLNGYVYRF